MDQLNFDVGSQREFRHQSCGELRMLPCKHEPSWNAKARSRAKRMTGANLMTPGRVRAITVSASGRMCYREEFRARQASSRRTKMQKREFAYR